MPSEPWRINFPLLREPWTQQECLVLWCKPIEDARGPAYSPTMCNVVGFTRKGEHYKFTVPIASYEKAALAPRHFIECDSIRAAAGTMLVDAAGKALNDRAD